MPKTITYHHRSELEQVQRRLRETPGITVLGPKGAVQLSKGVIRAERHVHTSTEDMAYYGVKDGDYLKLRIDGPCGVVFDRVKVRYHPKVILEVHIDTDEGNAANIRTGMLGYIEEIQSRH